MEIVIAIPTRRRPEMLMSCLRSIATLTIPEGDNLRVVVLENDRLPACKSLVSLVAEQHPQLNRLVYRHEPRLGIAVARNACVRLATEFRADVLAFIDDDETVTSDWLSMHIQALHETNADLLGGPVRLAKPEFQMNKTNYFVFNALKHQYLKIEMKSKALSNRALSKKYKIYTNNWVCKMAIFKDHNIAFNEELGLIGGEDTEFYDACIEKGIKAFWVSDAVVWDHLPRERLTFKYWFKRYRDQSNADLHYKKRSHSISKIKIYGSICFKILTLPLIAVAMFFSPYTYSLKLIRTYGTVVGRLDALRGKKHAHYQVITGS